MNRERRAEIVILGGGIGGCAAALAAARAGRRVILTEETDWIGGQWTAQAVPPDEHGWIEQCGCTASYRRFRQAVRQYYRDHYPLVDAQKNNDRLNPGGGWVSPLCCEPRAALAATWAMLAPHVSSGLLTILLEHRPVAAETDAADRVRAIHVEDLRSGGVCTLLGDYFIDATELGDLLPLAGVEHVTGAESQAETGESLAPDVAQPDNAQALSVCFAVDHLEGENHVIDRPAEYAFWRDFVPRLDPPWPGRLLSWNVPHPRTMQPITYRFEPHGEDARAFSGLWSYRRILARDHFAPDAFASDVCLINWPMNDYLLGDLCNANREQRRHHLDRAKQQSLSLLYWMQTEAPRADGGQGFPGLRLRADVVGTRDGLAKSPYIRESRRIRAEFTVVQRHVSADARREEDFAEPFADSVGVGFYRIDLHPTTGGNNYLDIATRPFQIPLGAMIPCRVKNLLPAAKNLGTTHITNGCYRLHPVEWNLGEAAGALAAYCMEQGRLPREVREKSALLVGFQDRLLRDGVELQWPRDLNLAHGDPHIHAQ